MISCMNAGVLKEMGTMFQDVVQAPLPGVGQNLNDVLRSAAKATGLINATESVAYQAQAAGVTGNFTKVRLCII